MIRKSFLLVLCCMFPLLSACQEIGKGGRIAEKELKQDIDATKDALERVFTYYPENEEYKPIPYAFCYRVMQDITCYDHPLPEARSRLVGWQGRGSKYVSNKKKLPPPVASVQQVVDPEIKEGISTKAAIKVEDEKKKKEKEKKEEKVEEKKLEPVFTENPEVMKDQKIKIKVNESDSAAMY